LRGFLSLISIFMTAFLIGKQHLKCRAARALALPGPLKSGRIDRCSRCDSGSSGALHGVTVIRRSQAVAQGKQAV
jgi:hypothetical protein